MIRKTKLKFLVVLIMIVAMFATTTTVFAATNPFKDVSEDAYYYEPVMWAVENNITKGVSDEEFGVDQNCTRAQGLVFLWRALGSPEAQTKDITFKDVKSGDYFYDAVCWGVENNVIKGYSDTEFGVDGPLTRGQFVTILWRSHGEPEFENKVNPFKDVKKKDYFYESVLWAVENGITSGVSANEFDPNGTCLRAQAVTFMFRDSKIEREEKDNYEVVIKDFTIPANATEYGLSTENDGLENSKRLQALIDAMSVQGGTIYIPAGEYAFAENGTQTYGSHCIKMKSNVTIVGDGQNTILMPTGESKGGLDMFYFNEYVDTGKAVYLENCNFENFVIDSANTYAKTYTSAGKGFMFNLFKNCNWKNITVKNTDGTGFGVDCPIGGVMENCIAINCGKGATYENVGASGFGIGYGYSEFEHFTIKNCKSYDNKKFGFFFEHQGRFSPVKYPAGMISAFVVTECEAAGNYYNFGGIGAMNTVYISCESDNATIEGYYFENSKSCAVLNCRDNEETGITFLVTEEVPSEPDTPEEPDLPEEPGNPDDPDVI